MPASKPHALTPPSRFTQIFARIEEMWQSVMGPDGLVGQSLNSMKAQFESSIPILLEPIFGGIDDIMSGAVDLSCEFGNKMLTTMTDVVQKNAIFLPGYCWAKHYYDGMTLMTKRFRRWVGLDQLRRDRLASEQGGLERSWGLRRHDQQLLQRGGLQCSRCF